jgi:hypothetical protein
MEPNVKLTQRQQFRKHAVEHKTGAYRVWKSRMTLSGFPAEPEDYILYGYEHKNDSENTTKYAIKEARPKGL